MPGKFLLCSALLLSSVFLLLQGCYFFDYFQEKSDEDTVSQTVAVPTDSVLGLSLGEKAGGSDEAALEAVYAVTSDQPPASIRPDPDLYARRLLLQYRKEGVTVAKAIGAIEGYRLLLGGASQDFQKSPQEDFDATSLLANMTVAEHICTALVAPTESEHKGWATILPAGPDQSEENIRFLAQRFTGRPSSKISEQSLTELQNLYDAYVEGVQEGKGKAAELSSYAAYVSVCVAIAMDAEALFL